jgi:glycosyltransferase involved in cell wall biosynthesis
MNKKKLIIFIPSIEGGGVEKNLFLLSNYLAKNINETKIITSSFKYKKRFSNIEIIAPKLKFWNNFGRKMKYLVCLYYLTKTLLKDKNYLVFSFQANLYSIIVCKILNIKIIVRANSSPSGWSKGHLKTLIFKKILKLADKIIVNSYDFKDEISKKFLLNSKCIYNPLNKEFIKKKSKEKVNLSFFNKKKTIRIITIGRLVDQKDHVTLIKAINIIKNKVNLRLLIIGNGKLKNKLQLLIKNYNLHNKIKILNFQKNPFKYLKLSDLFILSSKYEGLPNVLLEAGVLKKFIISSDCSTGPREILKNGRGGLLFKIGDYKDLSNKIIYYEKNKKKLINKINYTYKSLYRFDYLTNLKNYLKVINKQLN